SEAIRRFDFDYPARGRSPILELDQLALSMAHMKSALASFIEISASLSAEQQFEALLDKVLRETLDISEADGGLLYLINERSGSLEPQQLIIDDATEQAQIMPAYPVDST